jgi:hypothetical protein
MIDQISASVSAESAAQEKEIELRMHKALQDAWKYVNVIGASNNAKNKVSKFANADVSAIAGQRIPMLFALQDAWTFVHGAKDTALMEEMRDLLGHGQYASKKASPKI